MMQLADRSLGVGQTWQDVTASRVGGTIYTNTSGRPILVSVYTNSVPSGTLDIVVSSGYVGKQQVNNSTGGAIMCVSALIPAGHTYQVNIGVAAVSLWKELR